MNDIPRQHSPEEISALFSMLNPRDVEEFYRDYQLWSLHRQISQLQTHVSTLQQQLADNAGRLRELHPSPIALAALAQLQAHGVNDIDLLDSMLERGEDWLDQTMQRLAFCETFAIISDNYTGWCEHALDGAYDWIDTVQESLPPSTSSTAGEEALHSEPHLNGKADDSAPGEQITEAMLLQKLMSDETDASAMQEAIDEPSIIVQTGNELTEQVVIEAVAAAAEEVLSPQETEQGSAPWEETSPPAPAEASADEQMSASMMDMALVEESAQVQAVQAVQADNVTDPPQKREQAPQSPQRRRKRGFLQQLLQLSRS